jgi:DNA-binding response OmpR family regulator
MKNQPALGRRVLYVDDNPEMRRALGRALSFHGFDVTTAADVADAGFFFNAKRGDFDCILTDHHLSDGTGSKLSGRLREIGYKGRIIVLSGLLTEKDLALYEKSSISGFFRKPFELQKLIALLLQ